MKNTVHRFDSRSARLAAAGLLAVLAASGLTSCSRDARTLARVGGKTITVGEFLDVARSASGQYPFAPDSAKRLLLEDLIRRELMLAEAEQRGFTKDTILAALRRSAEQEIMLGALTEQTAPRTTPISEAELAAFYDWLGTEHKLQVIYTVDRSIAAQAMARIRAGDSFDQVAAQYNAEGTVPQNGDLGFIPGGAMLEPLDTRMRESRIDELIGPLEVANGSWFIARVRERRAVPLPARQVVEARLRQQLAQRKHTAQVQNVVAALRAEYQLRLEPDGAQEMFLRANRMPGSPTAEDAPDNEVVLARYRSPNGEQTYTMATANQDLDAGTNAPDYRSVPAIRRWIESRVIQTLASIEAKRRHLDQEPANVRRVQERLDGSVLQSLYDQEVSARTQVSDAELEAEYALRAQGQGMPPWDQVPAGMREQLRSAVSDARREELLSRFTSDLRARFPVTIDEPLLARLEWPSPALELPRE